MNFEQILDILFKGLGFLGVGGGFFFLLYKLVTKDKNDVNYPTNDVSSNQYDEKPEDTSASTEDLSTDALKGKVLTYPTFALIFGNNITDPMAYGSTNSLSGVAPDIKRVHSFLKSYGSIKNHKGVLLNDFNSDVFTGEKATSVAFLKAIKDLATLGKTISGKKYLIIYESGHGSQVSMPNDNDADKKAETRVFFDKMLIDDDTRAYIQQTLGGDFYVLNIVDRCESGGLAKVIKDGNVKSLGTIKAIECWDARLVSDIQVASNPRSLALVKIQSAAREGTYAYDNGPVNGGAFTRAYINGLIANKGNISYEKANKIAADACGSSQVPEVQDVWGQNENVWPNKNVFLT